MFGIRYRYLFMLLLAAYSYFNIQFTEGFRLFNFQLNPFVFFGIILVIVVLVWEGNRLLQKAVPEHPRIAGITVHHLIIFFLLTLVNVLFTTLLVTALVLGLIDYSYETFWLQTKLALGFGFRINLFLNCINAIVYFMNKYRQSQLDAEELKKMTAEAQFEALRNQINPHFLFNSFNVLSNLVHSSPDTADKFLQQLSRVYRYLLYNQEKKVVTLETEMEFIESYLYLLQIRFGSHLQVDNQISDRERGQYMVAPATLQMLIENAIKHNVVSARHPLQVQLFTERNTYLVVQNTLRLKDIPGNGSSIGLANIRKRYAFISDLEVIVSQSQEAFIVKVPLIHQPEEVWQPFPDKISK